MQHNKDKNMQASRIPAGWLCTCRLACSGRAALAESSHGCIYHLIVRIIIYYYVLLVAFNFGAYYSFLLHRSTTPQ